MLFFFNDPATTEIYTLSLHDALPISLEAGAQIAAGRAVAGWGRPLRHLALGATVVGTLGVVEACPSQRSEEHTSELQSHHDLVCRLLLEKKKKNKKISSTRPY